MNADALMTERRSTVAAKRMWICDLFGELALDDSRAPTAPRKIPSTTVPAATPMDALRTGSPAPRKDDTSGGEPPKTTPKTPMASPNSPHTHHRGQRSTSSGHPGSTRRPTRTRLKAPSTARSTIRLESATPTYAVLDSAERTGPVG